MEDDASDQPAMSGSLIKGLVLIERLSRHPTPMGVAQLARLLDMSKGGVHRLLQVLRTAGWVRQTPEGTYECTLRAWEIGNRVIKRTGLRPLAMPHLRKLWEQTQETTYLAILDKWDALYLEKIDSPKRVLASFRVGHRLSAYRVAAGRALLAHVEHQPSLLMAESDSDLRARLEQDLAMIRDRGFSVNGGEFDAAINGIAAPVFDASGAAVASVGFSCPSERFTHESLVALAPAVMQAARAISRDLGHVSGQSIQ